MSHRGVGVEYITIRDRNDTYETVLFTIANILSSSQILASFRPVHPWGVFVLTFVLTPAVAHRKIYDGYKVLKMYQESRP